MFTVFGEIKSYFFLTVQKQPYNISRVSSIKTNIEYVLKTLSVKSVSTPTLSINHTVKLIFGYIIFTPFYSNVLIAPCSTSDQLLATNDTLTKWCDVQSSK